MFLLIRRLIKRNVKLSDLVRTKTRVSYPRSFHRGLILLARDARQQETYSGGFDNEDEIEA